MTLDTHLVDIALEPVFVERYQQNSGVPMETGHAAEGTLRGFFVDGELVGGYRLSETAGRYAGLVEDGDCSGWPFSPDEAAEVTHLWMAPDLDVERRRAIYARMLVDLLSTGKRFVVGGSIDPTIVRQQRRMLPALLHEGRMRTLRGLKAVWLYYGTPATLLAGAIASGVPMPWLSFR